jgi:AraC-like DNA-binding protein
MSITGTVVHSAETRFVEAAAVLQPYVGCFWVITAQRGATIRVVPDGSTAIFVERRANRSSGWLLRGPLLAPHERRFSSPATMIGVRLRPGVAFLVTSRAADTMLGRRIKLSGTRYDALAATKAVSRPPADTIDALQRFLIDRLAGAHLHPIVARAVDAIERADGCARVAEIATECGISPRHLGRLMRTWVGYGPKSLARIVRFQEALTQIENLRGRGGAALAADTGYFDQAHLAWDLSRMAGATPHHLASRCVSDFYKTRCDVPLSIPVNDRIA